MKRDLFLVVSVCFGIFSLEEDEVDERTPQFHASIFLQAENQSLCQLKCDPYTSYNIYYIS